VRPAGVAPSAARRASVADGAFEDLFELAREGGVESGFEGGAVGAEGAVVDGGHGDTEGRSAGEAGGGGVVREHEDGARGVVAGHVAGERQHVAAAARDEDRDTGQGAGHLRSREAQARVPE